MRNKECNTTESKIKSSADKGYDLKEYRYN